MYVCMNLFLYVCMYMHVSVHVYMYVCLFYVCMFSLITVVFENQRMRLAGLYANRFLCARDPSELTGWSWLLILVSVIHWFCFCRFVKYVCFYVCMQLCKRVYLYACMYLYMHESLCICIQISTYVCQ